MKAGFCLFLSGFIFLLATAQQDPQFSMYFSNGFAQNPSYAGSKSHVTSAMFYRKQWYAFDGAPETASLFVHGPSRNQRHGFGFLLLYDKAGAWRNSKVTLAYSIHFPMGKNSDLAFGLSGGINQLSVDIAGLQTGNPNDPVVSSGMGNRMAPRLAAGLHFRTGTFQLGISAGDPLSFQGSTPGGYQFVPHFTGTTGISIPFSDAVDIEASVIVQTAIQSPATMDTNFGFLYKKKFKFGAGYRISGSFIFFTQFQLNRQLLFGYSYDFPVHGYRQPFSNTHELMLTYDFRFIRHGVDSMRYF